MDRTISLEEDGAVDLPSSRLLWLEAALSVPWLEERRLLHDVMKREGEEESEEEGAKR